MPLSGKLEDGEHYRRASRVRNRHGGGGERRGVRHAAHERTRTSTGCPIRS